MNAGVGTVSVRPLELCLWGACRGLPAVMRGSGAVCAGWPVRRLGGVRPPNPRGARWARTSRDAPDDDSGLQRPHASVVPGSPPGRGVSNIRRTRRMVSRWDLPRGVKHPADFHNDASQRNCKRYVSDYPLR